MSAQKTTDWPQASARITTNEPCSCCIVVEEWNNIVSGKWSSLQQNKTIAVCVRYLLLFPCFHSSTYELTIQLEQKPSIR